jgi:D-inositol-3-phosphate glycosyltransferase
VGGLAYLVRNGETGYTVPDGDSDALCNCLTGLLGDVQLRWTLGRQAAEYAQNYSWEKIAAQIVEIYQELVK